MKRTLYFFIATVTLATTLLLIGATIYLNHRSVTGGPVHWHADIDVWACGKQLNFVDPVGRFSNKIGTATFHEHNDQRLHVEGVVVNNSDVTLGRFFTVIGGSFQDQDYFSGNSPISQLVVPTTEGIQSFTDGDICPDGQIGVIKTYLYKSAPDQSYSRVVLGSADRYVMSPQSQVPPGDCIVIVFGPESVNDSQSPPMCESYQAALQTGKLKGQANVD